MPVVAVFPPPASPTLYTISPELTLRMQPSHAGADRVDGGAVAAGGRGRRMLRMSRGAAQGKPGSSWRARRPGRGCSAFGLSGGRVRSSTPLPERSTQGSSGVGGATSTSPLQNGSSRLGHMLSWSKSFRNDRRPAGGHCMWHGAPVDARPTWPKSGRLRSETPRADAPAPPTR